MLYNISTCAQQATNFVHTKYTHFKMPGKNAKQFAKRQQKARQTAETLSERDESLLVTVIFSTGLVQRGTRDGYEYSDSALVRFPNGGVALNLADSSETAFNEFEQILSENEVTQSRPSQDEEFDYDVVTDDGTIQTTAWQRVWKFSLATAEDVDRLVAVAMNCVNWGSTEFRFGLEGVDPKAVQASLSENNHVTDVAVTDDGIWTATFRHSGSLFWGDKPRNQFCVYPLDDENLEKCLYRITQGTVGRAMAVSDPDAVKNAVETLVNMRSIRRPIVGDKTPTKIKNIDATIDQIAAILQTVLVTTSDGLKVKRLLSNALSRVFGQLPSAPQKKTWNENERKHNVSDINAGQMMGHLCRHADSIDSDGIGYSAKLVDKTAKNANAVLNALETLFAEDGVLESISVELLDFHIVPEDDTEYDEVEAEEADVEAEEADVEEDALVSRTLSAAAQ